MLSQIKQFSNHKGFMKYFKNTSWLFGEKILRMTIGLFVGVWVARYLGPEKFGLFSYVRSFVGLFIAFATLGLDGIVIRELVKDEGKRDVLLGTAFVLKLIGAIIVLSIISIAVNFTSNDSYTNILVLIIASSTIFQSFNVIDFYFQSKVLSKYIVFANIISLFISSIVKILLILNNASLIAFVIIGLFDSFILAMGLLHFYLHNQLSLKSWRFEKYIAVSLLKDCWPLMFSGAVLMIQARIDQVMLREMKGYVEVGYYSVALRLIEIFAFVPVMLKNSLYPSIINAKNISIKMYQNRLLNFYKLINLLFWGVGIPIFFFSEKIVVLLYGIEYQHAGILLALMVIRLFLANMGVARGAYILTENLFKYSLITMILGTLANIILNYILIKQYGAKGAIVSTIFSFFVTIFLLDIFYSKTKSNAWLMIRSMFSFYKINLRS